MDFVAKSDVGKRRKNNEDSYFAKIYNENIALFVVADGLGGYLSGEVASGIITETMSTSIEEYLNILCLKSEDDIKSIFKEAVLKANDKIYSMSKTDPKYDNMGTTVVAILKVNKNIYYTSVGDTRIYYIDEKCKKIEQITQDDTYVNELLKTSVITEDEAKHHPQKHMLTKAVGILKVLDVNIHILKKGSGYILLCTDGLTNMLSNKEILEAVNNSDFLETAEKLVLKANEKGGDDNITVVFIKKENK